VRRVRLDEIAPTAIAGVNWRPVRAALDLEAFGLNSYTGDTGELVVEPHDETGGGAGEHDEVYVVMTGRATFTVDGESFDAPAGTFVLCFPGEHRQARAEEDGTTVLAIGGRRDAPYTVSDWEYRFRAYRAQQEGRLEEAMALSHEGLAQFPESGPMLYNLACFEALAGLTEPALEHLLQAAERDPRVREWARGDDDLASLRDDPRFPA